MKQATRRQTSDILRGSVLVLSDHLPVCKASTDEHRASQTSFCELLPDTLGRKESVRIDLG